MNLVADDGGATYEEQPTEGNKRAYLVKIFVGCSITDIDLKWDIYIGKHI